MTNPFVAGDKVESGAECALLVVSTAWMRHCRAGFRASAPPIATGRCAVAPALQSVTTRAPRPRAVIV